jgi:hypothetical protein
MLLSSAIKLVFRSQALVGLLAFAAALTAQNTPVYFEPAPGAAEVQVSSETISLSNHALAMSWRIDKQSLRGMEFHDRLNGRRLEAAPNAFTLLLEDGRVLNASEMRVAAGPKIETLAALPTASRVSERIPGKAIVVELEDTAGTLQVSCRASLRDGSNYIRQEIAIAARGKDVAITEVRGLDWVLPDARLVGSVKGSPIVAGDVFVAMEHPLATCTASQGRARCRIDRELPLKTGKSVTYSTVVGVTPAGQLRRGFLYYVERERAHPYRTFLHYNSWYDLGYFNRYDEAGALAVVNAFGTELSRKRGVKLSSFLFDDGWDDPATLWHFNAGFPNGFTEVRKAAARYDAAAGVWMSPWGGYGKPKQQRVAAAKSDGYEIVDNGFALSGPKYYALFRDTCLRFIRDYGVNQFKFDGTGNADRVFPGSAFDSDFAAAINLISELRTVEPEIYINLTTGTYPSPFWLRYADSIWRDGDDHSFLGVGSNRQRWITYRDAEVYEHIVLGGPLYPLNSLMLHGIIYAKQAKNLDTDLKGDFKSEVRDYFGSGTGLQEMYITPSLLSAADWDKLAEAANWSRANADVLVDTHWIGGDPAQLEVYGWASWKPDKAVLVLRNPSDRVQTIEVDVAKAFELPAGAAQSYRLHSPWNEDRGQEALVMAAGQIHKFSLQPFEVLVLQGSPSSQR